MDPLVLLLLVVIVFAGGVIGVLADHLGRRIGKKKLSFRSIRPKRMAQLGTFVAGTLVSLITILLVYSLSSDVREWIKQGRAAIHRVNLLAAENTRLEGDIDSKTKRIGELDSEALGARNRLAAATIRLRAIQASLNTANARLSAARQRVEQGRLALARSQRLLRQNQALLKRKQADLATVTSRLAKAQSNYADVERIVKPLLVQRDQANEEVVRGRNLVANLTRQKSDLDAAIDELNAQQRSLNRSLQITQSDLHDTQQRLIAERTRLGDLQDELRTEETKLKQYYALEGNTRTESLTYARGQEVARRRVGPHLSERQAHEAVTALLRDASAAAAARGSAARPDSEYCVFLPAKRDPANNLEISSEQIEDTISNKLEDADQDVVLIASAAANGFKGETLPIDIMAYHDPIVYRRGEVLGTLTMPRRQSLASTLNRFNSFMNGPIRNRALADRMIPAQGEEGSLFTLDTGREMDLLERLAHSDRSLQLQVVAHAETRAADSLQLDFVIK